MRKSDNNLQLAVQHFLIDALSNRGAGEHPLSRRYADILEAVAIVDSTSLVTVWPTIMEELQNDDAEPRARAVKLFGRILAAPGRSVAKDFTHYLSQFLRRFGDKDAEDLRRDVPVVRRVPRRRRDARRGDGGGYLRVSQRQTARLRGKVRLAAVAAVCDIAEAVLDRGRRVAPGGGRSYPTRRRRYDSSCSSDSARRTAPTWFASLRRRLRRRSRSGSTGTPSTLLKGCAQPDIRHHVVEPILVDLFPQRVSQERRSLFWLQALCKMDEHAAKAFNFMLRAKQSVQADVRAYLGLRQKCREVRQSQVDEEESPSGVDEDAFPRALCRRREALPRRTEGGGTRGETARAEGREHLPRPRDAAQARDDRGGVGDHISGCAQADRKQAPVVRVDEAVAREDCPAALRPRARLQGARRRDRGGPGQAGRFPHLRAGSPRADGA